MKMHRFNKSFLAGEDRIEEKIAAFKEKCRAEVAGQYANPVESEIFDVNHAYCDIPTPYEGPKNAQGMINLAFQYGTFPVYSFIIREKIA